MERRKTHTSGGCGEGIHGLFNAPRPHRAKVSTTRSPPAPEMGLLAIAPRVAIFPAFLR